jgi:RNA polymerase-binding transcription factor DksA
MKTNGANTAAGMRLSTQKKESARMNLKFPGSNPPIVMGGKWAWYYRQLLQIRERLIRNRAAQLQRAAQPIAACSTDFGESASDEIDHSIALGALSAEQDALYEVDEAIRRVQNGTYGRCQETGKPIPSARLRAIPWTRFVKEVEERLEQEGGVRRPHLGEVGTLQVLQSNPGKPGAFSIGNSEEIEANDELLIEHAGPGGTGRD